MSTIYDLHTHSTASDGTLSPTQLVLRAVAAQVQGLALTDHDTLGGLEEAAAVAHLHSIHWIPGIEISVTWNSKTIHIVGLNIDPSSSELQAGLSALNNRRANRAVEMGLSLAKHGIPDAFEGASKLSNGDLISRTHFARFLVQYGYVPDERQVFKRFLVAGKPGYVPGQWASIEDALSWIIQAGGQAVLAHPARYKLTANDLRRLIEIFRTLGGCALEVVSGSHSRDDSLSVAKLAREFGLLSSAGSDFHDPKTANIEVGRLPALPDGCVPIWQNWGKQLPTIPQI